jgi:hypothetical protein
MSKEAKFMNTIVAIMPIDYIVDQVKDAAQQYSINPTEENWKKVAMASGMVISKYGIESRGLEEMNKIAEKAETQQDIDNILRGSKGSN